MSISLTRLVAAGNRGSRGRLLGITAGVAVGVALFLLLWGAYSGLQAREVRSAWTQFGSAAPQHLNDQVTGLSRDEVLAAVRTDHFDGNVITRIDIAAPSDSTVEVPGILHPPEPRTFYASPALAELIDSVPADQLGDRYGALAGLIPGSALASPDSLVVIAGQSLEGLAEIFSAQVVTEFTGYAYGGNQNYQTVAIIGSIAILLPVLLLVSIVTDLGAAERRERFATLRLIGAIPRTVARIAVTETAITSLLGAILGVVLARILVPVAALISINDGSFYAEDLTVSPVTVLAVVLVTVLASAAVTACRSFRAGIGPLGATKQQQEHPSRPIRLIPILVGLGVMVGTTIARLSGLDVPRPDIILIAGFIATSVGLVIAGPYLTLLVSRRAAYHASSAAGVIAMNRIRRTPRATFRSVSGLVVAVFMVSVFAAAATTVTEETALVDDGRHLPLTTLIGLGLFTPETERLSDEATVVESVAGVEHAAIGYQHPDYPAKFLFTTTGAAAIGLGKMDDAEFIAVNEGYLRDEAANPSPIDVPDSGSLNPSVLLIATDGTQAAIERARTAVDNTNIHFLGTLTTRAENVNTDLLTLANSFANLANLGILITTLIAAVSLAVATIASILDRKRVLGLLRLMGMPVSTLRKIIISEAALPMLTVIGASIGLGFLVAWTILAGLTEGRRTISWPDPSYLGILVISILIACLAVIVTFSTARKNTGISTTRYE